MESLTYVFEERGLPFADDIEFQVDGLLRSRNLLKGWEADPFLFSGRDESMEFGEPGLPDLSRKSVVFNQSLENSKGDFAKCLSLPSTVVVKEFSTKDDKSDTSCLEIKKVNDKQASKESSLLSSSESSPSAKRARILNSQSLMPTCQVLGCNKDLSSSKDYHKRHKVCEVHSKTAVVIVNGIPQRFCQQCSRFHILAEFDEGKRSCRKRLAGHNERRRKPQLEAHLGSAFLGTDISRTSLFFSTIHHGNFFGQQCNNEAITHSMHIKLEESSQISQLPMTFGPPFPKSILHLHGTGKPYSKESVDGPSSNQDIYAGSKSSVALSLLSVQSQKVPPKTSAGLSMSLPLISKENHSQRCVESLGNGLSKKNAANTFNFPNGFDQEEFTGAFAPGGSEIKLSKLSQESNVINPKCSLSPEGANTLDLFQLSVHLQRVEQQKYSTQVEVGR